MDLDLDLDPSARQGPRGRWQMAVGTWHMAERRAQNGMRCAAGALEVGQEAEGGRGKGRGPLRGGWVRGSWSAQPCWLAGGARGVEAPARYIVCWHRWKMPPCPSADKTLL